MQLYEKLVSGDEKLALVGLGYVGMPIAVAFSKKVKVVGLSLIHILLYYCCKRSTEIISETKRA